MKVYTKNYIGKGKAVVTNAGTKLPIVKVVLSVEKMMEFVHEFNRKQYVSFEVAEMRNEDDFGNSHTVYHTVFGEENAKNETTPEAPKKKRGRPSKAEIAKRLEEAARVEAMQNFTDPKTNPQTEAEKAEMQMANADIDREELPY